jgi:hypothetical protein
VDYLTAVVEARTEQKIHREKFREKEVQPIWDYADTDRADALVEKTINRLGLKQHPKGLPLYMTPEDYEIAKQEIEGNQASAIDAELDALENAQRASEVDADD